MQVQNVLVPTQGQLIEIDSYFNDYIFGWMIGDLTSILSDEERNNLAFAILIFSHIEFLGGFLTGNGYGNAKNSTEFLSFMGKVTGDERYGRFSNTLCESFRNGLVHNYHYGKSVAPFGVEKKHVARSDSVHLKFKVPEESKDINGNPKMVIPFINLQHLFDDFKRTIDKFYLDVREGRKNENFQKRLAQIREERNNGLDSLGDEKKRKLKSEWQTLVESKEIML